MFNNLSYPVGASNFFTMQAMKQLPYAPYLVPSLEIRMLRAKLILEEAIETITALGIHADWSLINLTQGNTPIDIEEVIDGCCDLDYVSLGTILSFGANDLPHLTVVCEANNKKFPNGKPVPHPTIPNKFGKPKNWVPPDHRKIIEEVLKDRNEKNN